MDELNWILFSAFSRCMRCIEPPVRVSRRLSRSSRLASCQTRPFRRQLPTLQLMLRPMPLVGPSKLIHKRDTFKPHLLTHLTKHTQQQKQDGGDQLWSFCLSDSINRFMNVSPAHLSSKLWSKIIARVANLHLKPYSDETAKLTLSVSRSGDCLVTSTKWFTVSSNCVWGGLILHTYPLLCYPHPSVPCEIIPGRSHSTSMICDGDDLQTTPCRIDSV